MISEALRLIRIFNDLKQNELAEKIGVSASYISEIESGRKEPSLEILERYSKYFRIPRSSILLFAEEIPKRKISKGRDAIAERALDFLRLIEKRTKKDDEKR